MNCKEEEEAKTIWYSMDVIVIRLLVAAEEVSVSLVCVKLELQSKRATVTFVVAKWT